MSTVFKIRNKEGLFSMGSSRPHFTEKGKVWNNRAAVSGHLAMFSDRDILKFYSDADIVEFETIEKNVVSVASDVKRRRDASMAQRIKEDERYAREAIIRAEQQLKEAQSKLARLKGDL